LLRRREDTYGAASPTRWRQYTHFLQFRFLEEGVQSTRRILKKERT
jgi:hypothetical protein